MGVINDLSQVPTLRVMARSTVFRRASDRGARQVGGQRSKVRSSRRHGSHDRSRIS
jgi:hypothetical protein